MKEIRLQLSPEERVGKVARTASIMFLFSGAMALACVYFGAFMVEREESRFIFGLAGLFHAFSAGYWALKWRWIGRLKKDKFVGLYDWNRHMERTWN